MGNFRKSNEIKGQLILYGIMRMYSEAVQLALDNNMIKEAKEFADKPKDYENLDLKKKLWLQIAVHMLKDEQGDMNGLLDLINDSNEILKIEDLLPHFNQNVKLEYFKEQITSSIDGHVKTISELKKELQEYERDSEYFKNEIRNMKSRYLEVSPDQRCEECAKIVFDDEAYIFPCAHAYHRECLKNKIKTLAVYDQKRMVEIEKSEAKISNINQDLTLVYNSTPKGGKFLFGTGKQIPQLKDSKTGNLDPKELEKNLKDEKDKLDHLLSSECLACGTYWIETITLPLDNDEKLRKEWDLGTIYGGFSKF